METRPENGNQEFVYLYVNTKMWRSLYVGKEVPKEPNIKAVFQFLTNGWKEPWAEHTKEIAGVFQRAWKTFTGLKSDMFKRDKAIHMLWTEKEYMQGYFDGTKEQFWLSDELDP